MQHLNDKQRKEQLSALLDNQLKPDELQLFMDDLNRDPLAEGDTLQRYQLIGKTLRGELDAAAFIDVSAAVHRALAADTTVPATVPTKRRQLPQRWLPAMQTLLRPAAGLAIAASVAMVTIVSVRLLPQTAPINAPELVTVVTVVPAVVPVIASTIPVAHALTQTSGLSQPGLSQPAAVSPRLNNYLMRHSGVAGQATMQGVMPYARSVSFEQAVAP